MNKLHEKLKLAAFVGPVTVNSTPGVTGAVDMTKFRRVFGVIALGDMAAETIDFRLESDSATAFNVAVSTRVAATQLAAHASNNDNKQIVLELDAANLPAGHRYVRGRAVTGAGTGGSACMMLFGEPFHSVEGHAASVVQVATA